MSFRFVFSRGNYETELASIAARLYELGLLKWIRLFTYRVSSLQSRMTYDTSYQSVVSSPFCLFVQFPQSKENHVDTN